MSIKSIVKIKLSKNKNICYLFLLTIFFLISFSIYEKNNSNKNDFVYFYDYKIDYEEVFSIPYFLNNRFQQTNKPYLNFTYETVLSLKSMNIYNIQTNIKKSRKSGCRFALNLYEKSFAISFISNLNKFDEMKNCFEEEIEKITTEYNFLSTAYISIIKKDIQDKYIKYIDLLITERSDVLNEKNTLNSQYYKNLLNETFDYGEETDNFLKNEFSQYVNMSNSKFQEMTFQFIKPAFFIKKLYTQNRKLINDSKFKIDLDKIEFYSAGVYFKNQIQYNLTELMNLYTIKKNNNITQIKESVKFNSSELQIIKEGKPKILVFRNTIFFSLLPFCIFALFSFAIMLRSKS